MKFTYMGLVLGFVRVSWWFCGGVRGDLKKLKLKSVVLVGDYDGIR